jgi:hypothetical protein
MDDAKFGLGLFYWIVVIGIPVIVLLLLAIATRPDPPQQ